MHSRILAKLHSLPHPAIFPDLEDIPGFMGNTPLGMPGLNIIFWDVLSLEAGRAILGLVDDELISILPCPLSSYEIIGRAMNLPVVTDIVKQIKLSWMPVMLCLEEKIRSNNDGN